MLCNFLGPFYLIKTLPALYQQIWCYIYQYKNEKKVCTPRIHYLLQTGDKEYTNVSSRLTKAKAVTFVHSLSPVCNKKVFLECRLFFFFAFFGLFI